jgi:hypothetical protein
MKTKTSCGVSLLITAFLIAALPALMGRPSEASFTDYVILVSAAMICLSMEENNAA